MDPPPPPLFLAQPLGSDPSQDVLPFTTAGRKHEASTSRPSSHADAHLPADMGHPPEGRGSTVQQSFVNSGALPMHSSSAQASAALSIPKSDDADQIEQGIDQEMDDTHEPSAQVEEDLIDVEDPPPKMSNDNEQPDDDPNSPDHGPGASTAFRLSHQFLCPCMSAGTQDVQHTLSKQEFTQSCQAQQQATTNLSISLAASMHTPKQANLQTTTLTIVHPSQDVQNLQQLALAAVASTPNIDPGASNSNQHLSSNSNMALPPPPSTLLPQDLGRHPGIRF